MYFLFYFNLHLISANLVLLFFVYLNGYCVWQCQWLPHIFHMNIECTSERENRNSKVFSGLSADKSFTRKLAIKLLDLKWVLMVQNLSGSPQGPAEFCVCVTLPIQPKQIIQLIFVEQTHWKTSFSQWLAALISIF